MNVKRFFVFCFCALIIAYLMGCGSDASTPNALNNPNTESNDNGNEDGGSNNSNLNEDDDSDGYTENKGDCDDNNKNIHPGAEEICGDNIDQDCSGEDLVCEDSDYDDPDTYDPGAGNNYLLGPKPLDSQDFNSEVTPSEPGQCDPCNDGTLTIAGGRFFEMEGNRVVIYSSPVSTDGSPGTITQSDIISGVFLGYLWTDITGDFTFENTRNQGQPFSLVDIDDTDIFGSEVTLPGGQHRIIMVIDNNPVMDNPNQPDEIGDNDMIGSCVISVNGETFLSMYHDDLEWVTFGSLESDSNTEDSDGDGYTFDQGDCNDGASNIHPGAEEICGDSVDQDCNGEDLSCGDDPNDIDDDGDGFTENQKDCNDNNPRINPSANEICGNIVDENCDGKAPACPPDPRTVDNDKDGFTENQKDCNDNNKNIHPGAREICGNGVDENCDGKDPACPPPRTVDNDGDGFNENQGDCNDNNKNIYPGASEILDNKVDENCNGLAATAAFCLRVKISGSITISADAKEDCGL